MHLQDICYPITLVLSMCNIAYLSTSLIVIPKHNDILLVHLRNRILLVYNSKKITSGLSATD